MSRILSIIENKIDNFAQYDMYAAILGESPSKGAKSPTLWNQVFLDFNLDVKMFPFDIEKIRLKEIVDVLRKDGRFIGGAVTMPYKKDIIPYLDGIEEEAKKIGAVNCLYRNKGKLIGANTDGEGALWSLKNAYGHSLNGKRILLLGTGGAGLAVAAYCAGAIGNSGTLFLANRTRSSCEMIQKKLFGICSVVVVDWPVEVKMAEHIDILINCTSIGFETGKVDDGGHFSLKLNSPLGYVDPGTRLRSDDMTEYFRLVSASIGKNVEQTIQFLTNMNRSLVFDIIYQPELTPLLYLAQMIGHRILNGLPMNMEQAVIAYQKAITTSGLKVGGVEKIRKSMAGVY